MRRTVRLAIPLVAAAFLSFPLWAQPDLNAEYKPTNKPPEPQLTCNSASSSHSKKHQADRPLAETNTRFERINALFAPIIQVGGALAPAYTNVPQRVSVNGKSSSFRVNAQPNLSFTLDVFEPDFMAPIKLFRFDQVKSKREYTTGRWANCSGAPDLYVQFSCAGFVPDPGLPIAVTKSSATTRQITISSPLPPGEYAIEVGRLVFPFGVD
ncbi:MAG: hypothetical protein WCF30_19500 [Terracidiphilus sp.]